jgi:hypothetical protein
MSFSERFRQALQRRVRWQRGLALLRFHSELRQRLTNLSVAVSASTPFWRAHGLTSELYRLIMKR